MHKALWWVVSVDYPHWKDEETGAQRGRMAFWVIQLVRTLSTKTGIWPLDHLMPKPQTLEAASCFTGRLKSGRCTRAREVSQAPEQRRLLSWQQNWVRIGIQAPKDQHGLKGNLQKTFLESKQGTEAAAVGRRPVGMRGQRWAPPFNLPSMSPSFHVLPTTGTYRHHRVYSWLGKRSY